MGRRPTAPTSREVVSYLKKSISCHLTIVGDLDLPVKLRFTQWNCANEGHDLLYKLTSKGERLLN